MSDGATLKVTTPRRDSGVDAGVSAASWSLNEFKNNEFKSKE